MGLDRIAEDLKTIVWENEHRLSEYLASVERDVGGVPLGEPDLHKWLSIVSQQKRLKLEDAILVALLTK